MQELAVRKTIQNVRSVLQVKGGFLKNLSGPHLLSKNFLKDKIAT
jgi:hypothetical protein